MIPFAEVRLIAAGLRRAGELCFHPPAAATPFRRRPVLWLLATLAGLVDVSSIAALLLAATLSLIVALTAVTRLMFEQPLVFQLEIGRGIRAAGLVTASAAAALLSIGGATAVIRGRSSPLAVCVRRAVLAVIQPLVVLGLLPFTKVLPRTLAWMGGYALVILVAGPLILAAFGLLELALDPLFGRAEPIPRPVENPFRWLALGVLSIGVLLAFIVGLAAFLLAPSLKVLLDVFRYLGEPEYRARLQRDLDALVAGLAAPAGRRVFLVGHSLGSLIAVDSLLNGSTWRSTDLVTLVTMGSPIRRLLVRFFPGVLFPPDVGLIADGIRARVGGLRWVNVYRPFDQIGGRLGLERANAGGEVSTGQWRRLGSAHINYWSDARVLAALRWRISTVEAVPASSAARETWIIPGAARSLPARLAPVAAWPVAVSLAAAIAYTTIASAMSAFRADLDARDRRAGALLAAGVVVPATAVHWSYTGAHGGAAGVIFYKVDHFRLAFQERGRAGREVHLELHDDRPQGAQAMRIDLPALRSTIRRDCAFLRPLAPLQRPERAPCQFRGAIDLRYLPEDWREFDLPDYPRAPATTSVTGFLAAGILGLGGFVAGAVVLHGWLLLLAGAPPRPKPEPERSTTTP